MRMERKIKAWFMGSCLLAFAVAAVFVARAMLVLQATLAA